MSALAAEPTPVTPPAPSADPHGRSAAAAVADAEAAVARGDFDGALAALDGLGGVTLVHDEPRLAVRATVAEARARLELGEVERANALLDSAREVADRILLADGDRAAMLYALGAARLTLGSVGEATALLTLALDLCNRAPAPDDLLRTQILERRARCHRHNRDFAAARSDVERALELAESIGHQRAIAQACLQASIVAEREGQWIMARFYVERARQLFTDLGDVFGVGKCLNNLGGLEFLLGDADAARKHLKQSFSMLLDLGRDVEAAYAVSSLAQVQLRTGEFDDAERLARRALVFIGSRVDHRTELGNGQIVLGRALLELGRLDEADETLRQAEATLERAAPGERAAVWIAQGEVATRRGDVTNAATLYRRAAEALQDFHF